MRPEVELELDALHGRFTAHFRDDVRERLPTGTVFAGAFVRHGGWILTGATLRTSGEAAESVSHTSSPVPPGAQPQAKRAASEASVAQRARSAR